MKSLFLKVHLLNALIGLLVYVNPIVFLDYGWWIVAVGISTLAVSLIKLKYSVFFQTRILLLATIGYFSGIVKAINPNLAFSTVAIGSQTPEIGAKMFALTSIALFGASAGFIIAWKKNKIYLNDPAYLFKPYHWMIVYLTASVGVLITGYLSAISYGPTVFNGTYASGEGEGQLLGNLQSMGVIFLVLCFISAKKIRNQYYFISAIILALYFLGWGILIRGGRLEVLSGLLALFVAVPAVQGKVSRLNIKYCFIILLLAIFMEAWGTLRSTLYGGATEDIIDGYVRLAESGVYFAGTISGIATTFANLLHMVDTRVVGYSFGETYFNYILRSPPEFIYASRPPDLSMMFEKYGYESIGGFFELAEAYLNFGIFGCLIIPFIISFVLAKVYRRVLCGSWFYLFLLSAMLSVFFRGAWYQTFAFYKSLLTGFILFIVFNIISYLIKNIKYSNKLQGDSNRELLK